LLRRDQYSTAVKLGDGEVFRSECAQFRGTSALSALYAVANNGRVTALSRSEVDPVTNNPATRDHELVANDHPKPFVSH